MTPAEQLVRDLNEHIERARSEWSSARDSVVHLQKLRADVRATSTELSKQLFGLRRTLRALLGSTHHDFQALRAGRMLCRSPPPPRPQWALFSCRRALPRSRPMSVSSADDERTRVVAAAHALLAEENAAPGFTIDALAIYGRCWHGVRQVTVGVILGPRSQRGSLAARARRVSALRRL